MARCFAMLYATYLGATASRPAPLAAPSSASAPDSPSSAEATAAVDALAAPPQPPAPPTSPVRAAATRTTARMFENARAVIDDALTRAQFAEVIAGDVCARLFFRLGSNAELDALLPLLD
jgi:hypothetical protein